MIITYMETKIRCFDGKEYDSLEETANYLTDLGFAIECTIVMEVKRWSAIVKSKIVDSQFVMYFVDYQHRLHVSSVSS